MKKKTCFCNSTYRVQNRGGKNGVEIAGGWALVKSQICPPGASSSTTQRRWGRRWVFLPSSAWRTQGMDSRSNHRRVAGWSHDNLLLFSRSSILPCKLAVKKPNPKKLNPNRTPFCCLCILCSPSLHPSLRRSPTCPPDWPSTRPTKRRVKCLHPTREPVDWGVLLPRPAASIPSESLDFAPPNSLRNRCHTHNIDGMMSSQR